MFWEAEHVGAGLAAQKRGARIYWNAPTREDDVEAQIALVDRIAGEDYQGLVLAPDQALALMTPVRRALARGLPTVVIGSPLAIPAGNGLSYILNDDQAGGRLAADRVAAILHESGTVALLGINPDVTGSVIRARVFEQILADRYPHIRIVEKRMGSMNFPLEQQVVQETLHNHPDLDVIVPVTGTSVDATLSTLNGLPAKSRIRVVAFNVYNWPVFRGNPNLDCVIQEDVRVIGERAVELILDERAGKRVEAQTAVPPAMITRENVDSAQVQQMWPEDSALGSVRWSRIQ